MLCAISAYMSTLCAAVRLLNCVEDSYTFLSPLSLTSISINMPFFTFLNSPLYVL